MTNRLAHPCPGCGTAIASQGRYPGHTCQTRLSQATDAAGDTLAFGNVRLSGGLNWRRRGGNWSAEVRHVLCLIVGHPVTVTEAQSGGAVAVPAPA